MSIKVGHWITRKWYWSTSKMEREEDEHSEFVAKLNERQKFTFSDMNPETIRAAVREYEAWVDSCAAAYPKNALVRKTATKIKSMHRDELMKEMSEMSRR